MPALWSWVERLVGKARSAKPAPRRPAARPRVEALEDRTALSTATVPDIPVSLSGGGGEVWTGGLPTEGMPPRPPREKVPSVIPSIGVSERVVAGQSFTIRLTVRFSTGEVYEGYRGRCKSSPQAAGACRTRTPSRPPTRDGSPSPPRRAPPERIASGPIDSSLPDISASATVHVLPSAGDSSVSDGRPGPRPPGMQMPQLVVRSEVERTRRGRAVTFTVRAFGADGRVDTDFAGTVSLSSTDRRAVFSTTGIDGRRVRAESYTFTADDDGVRTFRVVFRTRGSHRVRVADQAGDYLMGTLALDVR